jgi:phosphoribosylformylglycinamidine synthase PurS subunit
MSNEMKVGVKIMPRDVILDTQGRAVEASMKSNGFDLVSCRVGKFVEVILQTQDQGKAKQQIEKMLNEGGLYNPLIEKFEIQL